MLRAFCLLAALAAAGPAAAQGAAYYPSLGYGQAPSPRLAPRPPGRGMRQPRGNLHLPDSFFVGGGGVGPAQTEQPAARAYIHILPRR